MTEAQETATKAGRAQDTGSVPQPGGGIGRAAVLIGAITIVSNLVGFGRQLVFAHTVSATCLGTAYATANQVPNIIYDVVLGGALTSVLIPVLAGPAARRLGRAPDPRATVAASSAVEDSAAASGAPAGPAAAGDSAEGQASQIASAALSWTVLVLAPVSVVIAVTAAPLASLLLAGAPRCAHTAIVAVSTRMLVVFAPQILLYGLAVVLYGILQAHRRFTAPAIAPVLSSLVVISAYLAFLPLSQGYGRLATLPRSAELMLSVGTTAGVAALVLTAMIPALRLRLRLRPTLRFPAGVAPRIRGLAAVGLITLIAQDASVVAVMVLANGQEGQGALVLYNFGWQMFFVPYAVLAVPIATTAFPALAAAEGARFDETAAASTRAVMLVSWLGAALLAGAAVPASRLFTHHPGDARQLAYTFAAFAPGLIGYGVSTHLSRVLFADARTRAAAAALVAGWLLVIVSDVVAVALVPDWWVVPVLGLGNTIGLTVGGLALLGAVGRARGRAALRGTARAGLAGLAGAVAGAAAGAALSSAVPARGFISNAGVTILACGCVTLVFGGAALALDGGDLRALLARGRDMLPGSRLAGRKPPS
ncbi:MAG: putative peptidoglycan lipid flippase [Streptosporangiaceae bacterium]|nr:putative peptidoglycan lipid flippase [Streptosporangiaceae bacterium]